MFDAVFEVDFDPFFHGMPFYVKRRPRPAEMGIAPLFECFAKFGLQIVVCPIPALLECDVVPIIPDVVLTVHLASTFAVVGT